jgi:proline iminopeptidase
LQLIIRKLVALRTLFDFSVNNKIMVMKNLLYLLTLIAFVACTTTETVEPSVSDTYLDYSQRDDQWTGGVKVIPVETELGTFNVWTKRVGNNPDLKVLLLHGGPGATHEYFESADSYFPNAEVEYYYYDQLGSGNSDNPEDERLWELDRFVDEVEQVRLALGLDASNFVLLGHSWGGILGMEYALKYQQNLKGLVISNMVASAPEYMKYAQEVLGPQLPAEVLEKLQAFEAAGDYTNPRYLGLIEEHYYPEHVLRRPLAEWPEPVNRSFSKLNYPLYLKLQGPSEFGMVGEATLKNWDRTADLHRIEVPTLSIGAQYDTMDPEAMRAIADSVQNGTFLYCSEGGHMTMYDDAETYFNGIIDFLKTL